jgi:3-phosphoshikimate 1-carboxyvinyltransferase
MLISQVKSLKGELEVPGDKSISHRGVLFGAIATGKTEVENFLMGADCLSSISCLQGLGVEFSIEDRRVVVQGAGKTGLKEPVRVLDAGNSGTTMRLLLGILAGQSFHSIVTGDSSLCSRPMLRVATPLRKMGAKIDGRSGGEFPPLAIRGGKLEGISYDSPVASAQVKSAVILAGLYAEGETRVTEPEPSRNHTELMLAHFGADITSQGTATTVSGASQLTGQKIIVPGDISSAAFFLVAGLIVPNSELVIKNVGINPTRSGIIKVLQAMGGQITVSNERFSGGEPVADLVVKSSQLKGTVVEGAIIPALIDEIPVIAVAAAYADGETIIRDAAELKVKESNRINTTASELRKFGAAVSESADGLVITGSSGKLTGASHCQSFGDHRIAMAMAVCGLNAVGQTKIANATCVDVSFPNFFQTLQRLAGS